MGTVYLLRPATKPTSQFRCKLQGPLSWPSWRSISQCGNEVLRGEMLGCTRESVLFWCINTINNYSAIGPKGQETAP